MVIYISYPHDGEIHGEIHMNFARKVRFMVDGERIAADDTAEKLGLEETVTLGASHGFHRNVGDFPSINYNNKSRIFRSWVVFGGTKRWWCYYWLRISGVFFEPESRFFCCLCAYHEQIIHTY